MQTNYRRIVFFDENCPFCRGLVHHLMGLDKSKKLLFAPLNGKTASELIKPYQHLDTVVFYLETQKQIEIFLYMKAVFRILFELGGVYKLIGWKYVLPSKLIDPFYKWFAKKRGLFKLKTSYKKDERFLP